MTGLAEFADSVKRVLIISILAIPYFTKTHQSMRFWVTTEGRGTVVLACPIVQFGLILWEKKLLTACAFFLVRATKKIKKNCSGTENTPKKIKEV